MLNIGLHYSDSREASQAFFWSLPSQIDAKLPERSWCKNTGVKDRPCAKGKTSKISESFHPLLQFCSGGITRLYFG